MTRSELPKVLVSACLLGQPVRYDGRASGHPDLLQRWQAEGRVVPLCPEVAGGLPTPRPPAEIPGGQGGEVLDGLAQVVTVSGEDVSAAFRWRPASLGPGAAARDPRGGAQIRQPFVWKPPDL